MTTVTRFSSVEGRCGRIITGRLLPDTEMVDGIIEMCKRHGVKHAYISCAIGSLKKASFVYPILDAEKKFGIVYSEPVELDGPIEFFGEQGIICQSEDNEYLLHLHGSFSANGNNVYGGHILPTGNVVLATLDVVINEVVGVKMLRKYDDETGFIQYSPENLEA